MGRPAVARYDHGLFGRSLLEINPLRKHGKASYPRHLFLLSLYFKTPSTQFLLRCFLLKTFLVCRMSCPNVNRYKGSCYTKAEPQSAESKALSDQVQQRLREREQQDAKLFPAGRPAAPAVAPPAVQPGAKDSGTKK